jgi:hypothetical protein
MAGQYQGHKNWNHWNVALWINNTESLYFLALGCLKGYAGKREQCARGMLLELRDKGITKTPDGAPYSVSAIRAAMRGLDA